MLSAWSDADARATVADLIARFPGCNEDLALRVYTSRLLGQNPGLVLHGGGNTSVKTSLPDDLGQATAVACIKGSGWDLATIAPPGLPAVRLAETLALRGLPHLSDEAMVAALRSRLLDPAAPNPSVEALLHAFLPHKFIDHSHADAILALADQPAAASLCAEVLGPDYPAVPYVMPGFALALRAAATYEAHPHCHGLVLIGHGLFSFGDDAKTSYERHITAVSRAEAYIAARRSAANVRAHATVFDLASLTPDYAHVAPVLRGQLSQGARPVVLHWRPTATTLAFANDPAVRELSGRGPVTPDHVIRTKQRPLVLDLGDNIAALSVAALTERVQAAVQAYRAAYVAYFHRASTARGVTRTMLDPDPRVILIPGLGLCTTGPDAAAARIAADIYERTIPVIRDAEVVGRYLALPDPDIFDMEYWSLEQAKLRRAAPKPLAGHVFYITGAASGIGLACAHRFAAAGAHLYLVDHNSPALAAAATTLAAAHETVDVTSPSAVAASLERTVTRFGGLDGVVSNAGAAYQAPIAECPEALLRQSLELNFFAHQWVASAAMAVFRRQGRGGVLLFNASKAALSPGPGFGPYAVAKAGVLALMRQYALEGAAFGVRANAVNADRVRTGLFSPDVLAARAAARGLTPQDYFAANLLGREVTPDAVAEQFLVLALASTTTGAIVPVDGGNLAAAPR